MYNVLMKIFLLLLLASAAPASAEWGRAESAAAAGLLAGRADISVISAAPLLELLAARDKASLPLEIGGVKFLVSVVFDAAWDSWVMIKPVSGPGAGAWKEDSLESGAVYRYKDLELKITKTGDALTVEGAGAKAETTVTALFDLLYQDSLKVTFGDAVTYAVFRNLEPLTEREGTVSLRVGSDGLYYFSLTPDAQIADYPRWLLAVNGVLYGLRIDYGSLLFVSKPIEMSKPAFQPERAVRR